MKRLLPVGTVLKLEPDKNEKIMIIGRLVKKAEEENDIWDYCGCQTPLGLAGNDGLKFFNHEQIKQLLFIGFQDEEELRFSVELVDEKEKIDKIQED